MAFEGYGGLVWSTHSPEQQSLSSYLSTGAPLGVAAVAAAGAGYLATRTNATGGRPLDWIAGASRHYGNLSPFQIGNTFRAPEWMSPFTSVVHQELTPTQKGKFRYQFPTEFSSNAAASETFHYLKAATGLDDQALMRAGISASGFEDGLQLYFDRTKDSSVGRLISKGKHGTTVLSSNMRLMAANIDTDTFINRTSSINRATYSLMGALGLFDHKTFTGQEVFKHFRDGAPGPGEVKKGVHPRFIPIPSGTGSWNSVDDAFRHTAFLRAIPAFELDRFSRLTTGLVENVFGVEGAKTLSNALGFNYDIRHGTAWQRFARLGGKAAAVGAGLSVLSQVDWMRRNFGIAGEVASSGLVAGGVGYLANRTMRTTRAGQIAGAAAFFGQMVLPGFSEGVMPGIATMYTKAMLTRAAVSPVNIYRRTLEGMFPGISDWKTGALAATGITAAAYLGLPGGRRTFPERLMHRYGADKFGIQHPTGQPLIRPRTTREVFWNNLADQFNSEATGLDMRRFMDRRKFMRNLRGRFSSDPAALYRDTTRIWSAAEETSNNMYKHNAFNQALLGDLQSIADRYSSPGFLNSMKKQAFGALSIVKHSFFGADPGSLHAGAEGAEQSMKQLIRAKGIKAPIFGRALTIFGGALLGHQLLTGGLFGSMESYSELSDIYRGDKLVEIQGSRFWEAGGTPFEGGNTKHFRPHWYPLMMNRVRQRGIWGDNEDSISPWGKFLRENFTYELERRNYYERPYPISGSAFENVPIIGKFLGATIGKLIKPARLMHVNEWTRVNDAGQIEFASVYKGHRREPAYSLGALGPGIPGAPGSTGALANFYSYQFRELSGLTGFIKNTLSEALTGEQIVGGGGPQLASAAQMTSPRIAFWDMDLGGMFFMNEAFRRILPADEREYQRSNAIRNTMPYWLPESFKYGDPYRSIKWGEARLPGSGFAALHPELMGINPQDYPLVYQYGILGDVAPFSKEFRTVQQKMYQARLRGLTSEIQNQYIDNVDDMVAQRFNINHYEGVHPGAYMLPGTGILRNMSSLAKSTLRTVAAPGEYLIPFGFRPIQKLLGPRDAIQQYEYERMYGTEMAFWDQPWRDWLRPSMLSAAHMLGYTGKPAWRGYADRDQAYWDQLEFAKHMQLADASPDSRTRNRHLYAAASTRFGVNPQGSPLSIYWSLPDSERQFFNAFAQAQGNARDRIISMVPEDQAHLYRAVWNRIDSGDPSLNPAAGQGKLDEQYLREQYANLSAALPPDDWIGWHQDVDIDDIRVRYLSEEGQDLHDHGMWDTQLQKSMSQPFLDGSTNFIHSNSGNLTRTSWSRSLYQRLNDGHNMPQIAVHSSGYFSNTQQYNFEDNRYNAIADRMGAYIGY